MNRRALPLSTGAWIALPAARAWAQSSKAPRRIGFLEPSTPDFSKPFLEVFTARLKELGHVDGRDIVIERRVAHGDAERLPALARELVALNPEVIVTAAVAATAALKTATSTVPVVFVSVASPDQRGFVASLARPGGNMTGTSFRLAEMSAKLVQVVRETLPAARRMAVLELGTDPLSDKSRATIRARFATQRFETDFIAVKRIEDFKRAYEEIARRNSDVLFVLSYPLFVSQAQTLAELAIKARLPMVGPREAFTDAGGRLSYDNDLKEDFRRAAGYVDRILKGAKPADLPVEQPDRYTLVVNLRTAQALGIKVPKLVMLRADRVIE